MVAPLQAGDRGGICVPCEKGSKCGAELCGASRRGCEDQSNSAQDMLKSLKKN